MHGRRRTSQNRRIEKMKFLGVNRVSKAPIETEAIDAERDEIAFRHGLIEGMRALRQAGGLADLFQERRDRRVTLTSTI